MQDALHNAEEASIAAATQAARADSLARALRKAEGTRDQLQRLKVGGRGMWEQEVHMGTGLQG